MQVNLIDEKSILSEVNSIAKLLINSNNTKNIKACFNAFKHLVDFYIS